MTTLQEAVDTFCDLDRSEYTNRQYRAILSRMAKVLGPTLPIDQVSAPALLSWFRSVQAHIKPNTASTYKVVITTFFKCCVEWKYITASPATILRVRRAGEPSFYKPNRAVPPDDLARMAALASFDQQTYAIFLFFVDTACRVGGIASLRLDRLFLDEGEAHLKEKGDNWVQVFFGPETAGALRVWLAIRPQVNHDYVFIQSEGRGYKPMNRENFRYLIKSLAKESGCSKVWTCHALRHSTAHALVEQQVPPTMVAAKLNHVNPSTTLKFYYPSDTASVQQMSKLHSLVALGRKKGGE